MLKMRDFSAAFTGLEAAIILISFIVIAAVFSYVILSAGFFTTQKAQETVYKSVEQSTTSIQLIGNVYGLSNDMSKGINEIKFCIGLTPGASEVDLTKMKIVYSTMDTSPVILTRIVPHESKIIDTQVALMDPVMDDEINISRQTTTQPFVPITWSKNPNNMPITNAIESSFTGTVNGGTEVTSMDSTQHVEIGMSKQPTTQITPPTTQQMITQPITPVTMQTSSPITTQTTQQIITQPITPVTMQTSSPITWSITPTNVPVSNAYESSFTTTVDGATEVTSMNSTQQVEIDFLTEYIAANTRITFEVRPPVGTSLSFSKTVPATISTTNVLY